jgi:hypothetical protein
MSSANRDILTVSLPICIPFTSSSCVTALARNSRTMLNKNGESGHPCLVPDRILIMGSARRRKDQTNKLIN